MTTNPSSVSLATDFGEEPEVDVVPVARDALFHCLGMETMSEEIAAPPLAAGRLAGDPFLGVFVSLCLWPALCISSSDHAM
jgi:hypothetical protein